MQLPTAIRIFFQCAPFFFDNGEAPEIDLFQCRHECRSAAFGITSSSVPPSGSSSTLTARNESLPSERSRLAATPRTPGRKQYVCSPAAFPHRKFSHGEAFDQLDCEMGHGIHDSEFSAWRLTLSGSAPNDLRAKWRREATIHRGLLHPTAFRSGGTTGPDEFRKRDSRMGIRRGTPGKKELALYRIGFGPAPIDRLTAPRP